MEYRNIKTGEIFLGDAPTLISTVVGSCMSFCVWDRILCIGGMAHYAFSCKETAPSATKKDTYYYGPIAIKSLFKKLKSRGSLPKNIIVKIAGGVKEIGNNNIIVGEKNTNIAKIMCEQFQIPIISEATGGDCGMKVKFNSATGEMFIQRLSRSFSNEVDNSEKKMVASRGLTCNIKPHQNRIDKKIDETPKKNIATENQPIKVMIVDDSKVIQSLFKNILSKDKYFEIFGIANDPIEAEALMKNDQPDVLMLDMAMPKMDGLTYLKKHLTKRKIPVIMVSGINNEDGSLALQSLEVGAIDFIQKPSSNNINEFSTVLKEKLLIASKVTGNHIDRTLPSLSRINNSKVIDPRKVVAIGSSTGGTVALTQILTSLPDEIPPILIVQHIPESFTKLLASRLNSLVNFQVKEAENNEIVQKGIVYIAPGNRQMKIISKGEKLYLAITDDSPVNKFRPSIDYLFDTLAQNVGRHVVGIILTGMGFDGAKGLLNIKNSGANTIAQNEESCVVFGMPKEAIKIGAANEIVHLSKISTKIVELVSRKSTNISA